MISHSPSFASFLYLKKNLTQNTVILNIHISVTCFHIFEFRFFQILQLFIDIVINHRQRFQPIKIFPRHAWFWIQNPPKQLKYLVLYICCDLVGNGTSGIKIVCFILVTPPYGGVSVITITVVSLTKMSLEHQKLKESSITLLKPIISITFNIE